jgi:site-specific DNA-methyltransferase (adenine-specific)
MDCMDLMKAAPDNHWDLAIVDPPYGIGEDGTNRRPPREKTKTKEHVKKDWDSAPPSIEYFTELQRVSKNQIIWGANHFINNISVPSPCWIVWNKKTAGNTADCELAWTSFKTAVRRFDFLWEGFWQEDMKNKESRIHPTQKPKELYRWLLSNWAKPGDKILDTHLGSGSIAIACYYMGFDLTGSELDPDYYKSMMERIDKETRQQELF